MKAPREDTLKWVCRLVEKAFRLGYRIFIRLPDRATLERLDELLWTFRPGSFLPHAPVERRASEPPCLRIWLGQELPEDLECDLLINLAPSPPPAFERIPRIAEVVEEKSGWEAKLHHYQERGADIHIHRL